MFVSVESEPIVEDSTIRDVAFSIRNLDLKVPNEETVLIRNLDLDIKLNEVNVNPLSKPK